MKHEILNYQFAIIGRFDTLYLNINNLSERFSNFKKELSKDIFPDRVMNCYILYDNKIRIAIHSDRIEFIFKELNEDDCDTFMTYFSILSDQIDIINRIAIHYNFFYKDTDEVLLKKISSSVEMFKNFGDSKELSLRMNKTFSKNDVEFNDIVTIQNGNVQMKNSFETIKALIVMCDINSAVGKSNNIVFDSESIYSHFITIFERLNEKTIDLNRFLEDR